jgi:DNA-binding transcriptional LysR family regulator
MRHISLRQLRVFESIARHMSFTRAAEELYLTQPTVSMQIKKLSDTVGLPLFEQVGKKIYLTDAGQELHRACRDILERLERLDMSLAEMKGLKRGRLRLTVITTAKYFAPELLGRFCEQYPGIEVALNVTNREEAIARLAGNEDDLYILGQPPGELDVVSVPFLENPLVVVARADHPLAGQKSIPLKRLAAEPFLVREPGSGTRQAFERLMQKHGVKINVKMEIGSSEAIKHAIAGGLGLAVLSRHSLRFSDAGRPLTALDVQHFPIERYWYVVHPATKQLSVVARTFLDFLHKHAQSVIDPQPATRPAAATRARAGARAPRTGR